MKCAAMIAAVAVSLLTAEARQQTRASTQPRAEQQARQPKQYTIEQFLNTTAIGGASFSADESRILFSSNKTGIWNAYTVPVGGGD